MEYLNKTFFLDSIYKLNPHFNMEEIDEEMKKTGEELVKIEL